jgi:putative membrane protein
MFPARCVMAARLPTVRVERVQARGVRPASGGSPRRKRCGRRTPSVQEILMDRRVVLTGLAAAAAAPAALAQQAQPTTPQTTMPQTGGAAGGTYNQAFPGNQPVQGGQMSQADMQHLQQTLMVGSVALQTSEIALQKAEDDEVKQFARFEADEQKGLAEVLRSMMEPAGTASAQGAPAQPQMDQKHAQMVQKLQQAKAGEEFDKMYVDGQIEGHQELLQIQEAYLKSNPRSREHMNVAKLARGHIKEHIAVLQDLKDDL